MENKEVVEINTKYYCSMFNHILKVTCSSISSLLCLKIKVNSKYCCEVNEALANSVNVGWNKSGDISGETLFLEVWILDKNDFNEIMRGVYQENGRFIILDMLIGRILDEMFGLIKQDIDEKKHTINYPKDAEDLLNQSIKDYMAFSGLPNLRGINLISSMPYESDQCNGRVVFSNNVSMEENDTIVFEQKIGFCEENYRIIRKLLQIAGREKVIVFDSKQFKIIGLVSNDSSLLKNKANFVLEFKGHMHWVLYREEIRVIQYMNGVYNIVDDIQSEKKNRAKIEKYYRGDLQKVGEVTELIKNVSEQQHGTLVIISSNAEDEANRLSENNRGIRIKPINLSDHKGWIRSITSIDGALILDKKLDCHSVGTLLDGPSVRGNISRGARYNSALSYVHWQNKEKKEDVMAIVISEDKMINIIYET